MHPSTTRELARLTEPIHADVFAALDAEPDLSGMDAGATATLAQMAARVGILIAFGHTAEAREELTRLVERAESFAADADEAMAEVMGRTETPEMVP